MISTMLKIGLGAGAMLALIGCGSPQNTYYTLNQTALAGAVSGSSRTVALDGVSIPGELDRPQIVVGLDDNRVDVREYDRWAEPLDSMVRRTLAENLRARLGPSQLLEKADKNSLLLSVAIDAFGRQGDRVVLRGRWTLKDQRTEGPSPSPHSFDQDLPVDRNAELPATVADMSRLLGGVADEIAQSIGASER
jgi:uncharacterized lipoprotein YmbA